VEQPIIAKRTTAACIVAAVALTAVAAASPATDPTHFAGVPADGVKASTPTTGRLLVGLSLTELSTRKAITWRVYTDGRIIGQKWTSSGDATVVPDGARTPDTGYVLQRLTHQGVQRLRSKVLSTGLFEQNLRLEVGGHSWFDYQVRRGGRLVTVQGVPSADPSWNQHFTNATPSQMVALASVAKLLADPGKGLPTRAWADRQIRAFVPARYMLAVDRDYPDISKLPAPAGKVLAQYKKLRRNGCQILTTEQARALLHAFVEAGISPSENHALTIAFALAGLRHPSDLHLTPALPETRC